MKSLSLLRHAKSSWESPGLGDIERPLSNRGKNDAPLMGKILMELGDTPELIISSPAKRAFSTAKRVARETGYDEKKIVRSNKLYMATNDDFIEVISGVNYTVKKLLIVGHNYGITDYANHLSEEKISSMPTCAVVKIDFDREFDWSRISDTKGTLAYFKYPKMYY
jgi:phosphohistidine phosphatase